MVGTWFGVVFVTVFPFGVVWLCGLLLRRHLRKQRMIDPRRCPNCGYDWRASRDRCSECGYPKLRRRRSAVAKRLRTHWPNEPVAIRQPEPDEQPVVVRESDNGMECDLLRQHLEARGIHCEASQQQLPGLRRSGPLYQHVLVVWSADADRARHIISDLLSEPKKCPTEAQAE